jgi:protein-S-isoprenylcysteine O-methyltransferase Ste14
MASEERGPEVVMPPPLIYLAPLVGGLILDRLIPLPRLPRRLTRPAGVAVLAGGVALTGWFLRTMGHADTPVDVRKAPRHLVVEGPFKYTRNPAYLAFAATYLGISLITRARWPVLLLPAALATVDRGVIEREEAYLRRRFGDDYENYRTHVRRWI